MKKFNSISELLKIATGKTIYLMLENRYSIRVSKKDLKLTAASIVKHGTFSGLIIAETEVTTHIEIN